VHDARPVRGLEGGQQPQANHRRAPRVQGSLVRHQLVEVRPVDQLHDDVVLVVVLDHVEQGDRTGVAEPGGGARLADDPGSQGGALLVAHRRRQFDLLDGDRPPEQGVLGSPYDAHAALAELRSELVPAGNAATNDILDHADEPYRLRAELTTPGQPLVEKPCSNWLASRAVSFQERCGDWSSTA
jgi:hypothetical protein